MEVDPLICERYGIEDNPILAYPVKQTGGHYFYWAVVDQRNGHLIALTPEECRARPYGDRDLDMARKEVRERISRDYGVGDIQALPFTFTDEKGFLQFDPERLNFF